MTLESEYNFLFSDTAVPDVFFTNYLMVMTPEHVKLYLYMFFLASKNKTVKKVDLCAKTEFSAEEIDKILNYLESLGLILRENGKTVLVDLKHKEFNKLYRLKQTSSSEEAAAGLEKNVRRSQVVKAINTMFFHGYMGSNWYTDIDAWFDMFSFEEDVMQSLFQYCYSLKKMVPNYVFKVAQTWHQNGVKTGVDLDNYLMERKYFTGLCKSISAKLGRRYNPFSEAEEEIINKWYKEYNYDIEIIELALKKSVNKSNPGLNYYDAILTDWYNNGCRTAEKVREYDKKNKKRKASDNSDKNSGNAERNSLESRGYDNEYLNSLYDNN